MSRDSWDERRRSLENEFFLRQDHLLTAKLRAQKNREETISDLELATGLKDPQLLGALFDLGVAPAAAMALTLVPLVRVAWADGEMDAAEREAILRAALQHGIVPESAAHELLLSWLAEQPAASLGEAWTFYVKALKGTLRKDAFANLQSQITQRAQDVAKAAGGFLGLGPKVSASEQLELDRIGQAFAD